MDVLRSLIGEELNAVSFVMDYVELHFNGPVVRCIADPVASDEIRSWRFPEAGSRDALCSLIGVTLAAVDFEEDKYLGLGFSDGRRVTIPLSDDARHRGEAVHYVPGINQPISVW
jgi:hypothetical protein